MLNSKALDKKMRRKANRKARALGIDLNLNQSQVFAERKFNKVKTLNDIIDNGSLNDKLAAGKAKRAMNEVWLKSGREYYDARSTPKEATKAVLAILKQHSSKGEQNG